MILKSVLEESAHAQLEMLANADKGLTRHAASDIQLRPEFVTVITGIRRCGKSTLLQQLMKQAKKNFAYFNFEDPRIFGFDVADFAKLDEALGDKQYYFFDEIQNIDKWELYIRKLHDNKKTICITGSNASLLSKELGTRLTGRHIQNELFPFDYAEACQYLKQKRQLTSSVDTYLEKGGFPLVLNTGDATYLQQLFRDILYRGIIVRYGIRNARIVESIALFLISNIGKEFSLNRIKNAFDVGSANSVAEYIAWFEDSYLIFTLPRFSHSLKSIAVNAKKVYTIDTGFARANATGFTADKGRLFENLVYLKLRRSYKQLYYFKEKGECDFVVKEKNKVTQLVQACYELNTDNMKRELNGLAEAMDYFGLKEGYVVTHHQNDSFSIEGKKIIVVSADKWLAKQG